MIGHFYWLIYLNILARLDSYGSLVFKRFGSLDRMVIFTCLGIFASSDLHESLTNRNGFGHG